MKSIKSSAGNVRALAFGVLMVVIVVFVFFLMNNPEHSSNPWNNTSQDSAVDKTATKDQSDTIREDGIQSENGSVKNNNFLVLDDWHVKFEIPTEIDEVKYYKVTFNNDNGMFMNYEFTTQRVEDLGESCGLPSELNMVIRLGGLTRRDTADAKSGERLVNRQPIDGFYYHLTGAQSFCSSKNPKLQMNDKGLIEELLLSLQAA